MEIPFAQPHFFLAEDFLSRPWVTNTEIIALLADSKNYNMEPEEPRRCAELHSQNSGASTTSSLSYSLPNLSAQSLWCVRMSPLVFLLIWYLKYRVIKLSLLPLGGRFSSLWFSIQKPSTWILSLDMPFCNFTPLKSLMYPQPSPLMLLASFRHLQITGVSLLRLLILLYLRQ